MCANSYNAWYETLHSHLLYVHLFILIAIMLLSNKIKPDLKSNLK